MARDLKDKLMGIAKARLPAKTGGRLPVARPGSGNSLPDRVRGGQAAPPPVKQVTMAAMIYTLGAGVLFVLAIYNLMQGSYFNGVMIFVPAGSLLVLAYKYLQ